MLAPSSATSRNSSVVDWRSVLGAPPFLSCLLTELTFTLPGGGVPTSDGPVRCVQYTWVSSTAMLAGPLKDRKSTRLNSSHLVISYAVFCLKKKKKNHYLFSILKKKKNNKK